MPSKKSKPPISCFHYNQKFQIGSKFPTVESLKEAAKQDAKVAEGEYRNKYKIADETRKRIKSTKCQNCPVTLYAVLNKNAGVWIQLNAEQKKLVHMILNSSASVYNIVIAQFFNTYQIAIVWVENEKEHTDECIWHMLAQNLQTTCQKFFDPNKNNDKLLLSVQKVAYAKNIENAFGEIKKAAIKSRDPNYIQNYLKKWKKDSEC
ncbi:837_t:CDS:2 [Gigaspora margarita]|uniref:837_t:CDS:1 n=1 Tax=Gigaspora margarita TaxID=4874 RepID=A0ABN7USB2_GIGMA|nr:837_t:CDS:2 [Gigaspora margarita]